MERQIKETGTKDTIDVARFWRNGVKSTHESSSENSLPLKLEKEKDLEESSREERGGHLYQ